MSGSENDPVLLFTPPRQSQTVHDSGPEDTSLQRHSGNQKFHIAVPSLSLSDKKKYEDLSKSSLTSDVEVAIEDVDAVVGEYRERKSLYYFARFQDGNIYKVCASLTRSQHILMNRAHSSFLPRHSRRDSVISSKIMVRQWSPS